MKCRAIFIGISLSIMFAFISCAQKDDFPVLKGSYLGQKPPGMTPEIFAPGIISTGYSERCPAFTPDGKEFYFILGGAPHSAVLFMRQENNRWIQPQVAPFSGKYGEEFTMSPDGNKIVFSSNRPYKDNGEPKEHYFCWIVERNNKGWGEPKNLGSLINSGKFSGYPSISTTGNLYFYSDRKEGMSSDDIYLSKYVNGRYMNPENLGVAINSEYIDGDPFIAPDESYLIFCSIGRSDGYGGADLYISYRKKDGSWTNAINMGKDINSTSGEICPSVSTDGKYLFFTSFRSIHKTYSEVPLTYEKKIKILNSPGNGGGDIYWVDAKIIEELKPKELK